MSAPQVAAFALASLVLAATPGPGVLYIVTRTLAQGRRAGLASVGGVALGNLGNALAAALGLAALFAVSTLAFDLLRYAGAAYLFYLALKTLRAAPAADVAGSAGHAARAAQSPPLPRILRDGFFVALLNPKTALFFAAFLPQFIDPGGSAMAQSGAFGAGFVVIAACTDTAYVLAAGSAAPVLGKLRQASAIGRYLTAAIYLGLALFSALAGSRGAK